MKIQEIFNEYIELLPYMTNQKNVSVTTTLYNSYIKTVFGKKEVSILLLTDYQNFANDLLLPNQDSETMSRDRIEQIIDILINLNRFAIKSKYGITENLAQQIELNFTLSREEVFEGMDFEEKYYSILDNVVFFSCLISALDHLNIIKDGFKKK